MTGDTCKATNRYLSMLSATYPIGSRPGLGNCAFHPQCRQHAPPLRWQVAPRIVCDRIDRGRDFCRNTHVGFGTYNIPGRISIHPIRRYVQLPPKPGPEVATGTVAKRAVSIAVGLQNGGFAKEQHHEHLL